MGLLSFLFGGGSSSSSTHSSSRSYAVVSRNGYEVSFDNYVGSDSAALKEVQRLAVAVKTRLANPSSSYIREWPSNYRGVFNDYFNLLLRKSDSMRRVSVGNGFYFGQTNSSGTPDGYGIMCYAPYEKEGDRYQQFEIGDWSNGTCYHNGVLIQISSNDYRDVFIHQADDKSQYYELIGNRSTWRDFREGYFNPYYR